MSLENLRRIVGNASSSVCLAFMLGAPLSGCGSSLREADTVVRAGGSQPPSPALAAGQTRSGEGCHTDDPSHLCLALKYVVFDDSDGSPAISEPTVSSDISSINRIWDQCQIHFQVDQFLSINPQKYDLAFHSAEDSDLDQIRKTFMDSSSLLVVTTGKWNRSGSLGKTGANAWTAMPGDIFYGVVLEAPVGDYPNIIAHELGHYLNLDHVSNTANLMNPVIYEDSKRITQSECQVALNAVKDYWKSMVR